MFEDGARNNKIFFIFIFCQLVLSFNMQKLVSLLPNQLLQPNLAGLEAFCIKNDSGDYQEVFNVSLGWFVIAVILASMSSLTIMMKTTWHQSR